MFGLFLLLLFLQQKGHALQLIAPSSHRAMMAEDVNIPCSFTVTNPPINHKFIAITWYFQGKEILRVQNADVIARDPRVSYTGRAEDGIADLSISNITIMDRGIYKCSILYTAKREEKEIRLDIQATPQINITDRVVVPNKESFLHSLISGFYPVDINIKWLRDGEILDNVDMEKPQRDPDGTYSVRSSVTITPTKEDKERIFACRVQHKSLTAPLQKDFQLVYGDIPSVHITSQAFKLNVVQELVCSVSGFYPESITVYWFLNDTLLENAKTRRINSSAMESVYPFTPTEHALGMELRCVVDHATLTIPHVERLLVQVTDLKAQYKHTIVIISVMLVGISGALTIILFLIKQRKKRLPKVRAITRSSGGIFILDVDHFFPEDIIVSWKVIQPPSSTKPRTIDSTILKKRNQDGTFNATSTCESLRQEVREDEPYIVQAIVKHNKLKHPKEREWRSNENDNKDFFARPEVEMIQIPKLFANQQTQLQCRISHFYPDELTVNWMMKDHGSGQLNKINDGGRYGIPNNTSQLQQDKTFTHTALLDFTPSIVDHGSEVICRVSHPCLKEPIERTTGTLQVLAKPKVQQPIQLPIDDAGDMVATFSLLGFYPEGITVTWSYGTSLEKKSSEKAISENPDGTFTVTSQCKVPGDLFKNTQFRVRVTWEHPSMENEESKEISVRDPDFPWHPRIEEITPIILQVQQQSTVKCKVFGYFSRDTRVTWLEKKGGSIMDCTQNTDYTISEIKHEIMANNSYHCSPSLSFIPKSVTEDLEIICRVEHPSLEHPIEQSTGLARTNVAPQENNVKFTISGSDQVLCSLSLMKFYPQTIFITWTQGEGKKKTMSSTKKIIQTNDEKTFDAISECVVPLQYFRSSVRVTWTHETLKEPGTRDLHMTDFPWCPVMEQMEELTLFENINARFQYKVSNYFPNDLTINWYKNGTLLSPDTSGYKQAISEARIQPDNTFSCIASLQFRPSLQEDQGSEFICKVEHPSMEKLIERSTGSIHVNVTPTETEPVRLTLCASGEVLCSLRLKKPSTKNNDFKWSFGGDIYIDRLSQRTLLVDDNGEMFDVISEIRIPSNYLGFPVRVTWMQESMAGPQYSELETSDIPWQPHVEALNTSYLIHNTKCKIQNKISGYFPDDLTVSWYKKAAETGVFHNIDNEKGYKPHITEPREQSDHTYSCTASLAFTPKKDDHGVDFMCSVGHPSLEEPIKKTTGKLPLIDLAWSPHVEEIETSTEALNTKYELRCKISGYFPEKLTVIWQKERIKLTNKVQYKIPDIIHQLQPDNTYSCTAMLVFTPKLPEDLESEFTCTVEHPNLKKPIERKVKLPVKEMAKESKSKKSFLPFWKLSPINTISDNECLTNMMPHSSWNCPL